MIGFYQLLLISFNCMVHSVSSSYALLGLRVRLGYVLLVKNKINLKDFAKYYKNNKLIYFRMNPNKIMNIKKLVISNLISINITKYKSGFDLLNQSW